MFRDLSISKDLFFKDYWQKKPLFGDNTKRLAFAQKDVLDILGGSSLKPTDVRVITKEQEVSTRDLSTARGSLDNHRVMELFQSGHTIVVPSINKLNRHVNATCRKITKALGASVQANLYYSPVNSQGFKAHWDNHDVLVYQVHGHKTWSVYNQAHCELPLQVHRCTPQVLDLNQAHQRYRMTSDKFLYIPRGFTHFANTDTSSSIHLTFALEYPKLCDVLHRMIDSLVDSHSVLRKALPMYDAHTDTSMLSDLGPVMAALASPDEIARGLLDSEAKNTFLTDVFDLYFTKDEEQGTIDAFTRIKVRESAVFSLQYAGDALTLVLPQRRLAIAANCQYLLFEICSQKKSFSLCELKGFQAVPESLVLVNDLDQLGFFERDACQA